MAAAMPVVLNPSRRSPQAAALLETLQARVVGQPAALEQMVDAVQTLLAGLNARQRPLANFLFLGPTGSGKTHVVEALAEALFQDPQALVKVDCAEFQHSHEIAKLVGSPPGYLGHRETHPVLTQEALDQHQTAQYPLALVLFDEVEKASDSLWQLLLGILDKATLTLGDNRRVSFARAMIFLTSNLGAAEAQALIAPGLGFAPGRAAGAQARMHAVAVEAARRKFSPEFFNRLDHVLVFQILDRPQLERVLELELNAVRLRLSQSQPAGAGVRFRCTPRARGLLLTQGTDRKYGARHLKRAIERLLVAPLASLLATGQVRGGDEVRVDCESGAGRLQFVREAAAGRG